MARNFLSLKFVKSGPTPEQLEKFLNQQFRELSFKTKSVAKNIRSAMVGYIAAQVSARNVTGNRVSTGNLIKSIQVHKTVGGYAVGDVQYMNKEAPYWAVVNWGHRGYTIPAISRKDKSKKLRFVGAQDGNLVYLFQTKARQQVIAPMNYIEWAASIGSRFFKDEMLSVLRKKNI